VALSSWRWTRQPGIARTEGPLSVPPQASCRSVPQPAQCPAMSTRTPAPHIGNTDSSIFVSLTVMTETWDSLGALRTSARRNWPPENQEQRSSQFPYSRPARTTPGNSRVQPQDSGPRKRLSYTHYPGDMWFEREARSSPTGQYRDGHSATSVPRARNRSAFSMASVRSWPDIQTMNQCEISHGWAEDAIIRSA